MQPAIEVCLHRADGSTCFHLFHLQILFLIVGLVTVLTGPLLYWRLDNSPADARFLTEEERVWACERVRANQTGMAGNYKWNLSQMFEAFWSPVTWLYLAMAFAVNMGASGKCLLSTIPGRSLADILACPSISHRRDGPIDREGFRIQQSQWVPSIKSLFDVG